MSVNCSLCSRNKTDVALFGSPICVECFDLCTNGVKDDCEVFRRMRRGEIRRALGKAVETKDRKRVLVLLAQLKAVRGGWSPRT